MADWCRQNILSGLERDVRDVFIRTMELNGNMLRVTKDGGHEYRLALDTLDVRANMKGSRIMKIPEYISREEVRKTCETLGIRDWTTLTESSVTGGEAEKILAEVNMKGMPVTVDDFRQGLEVELEHGTRFSDANVTNNHPIITGMIVLAHLKEALDYYQRLDVAEIEGDLLKAIAARDPQKTTEKYRKLIDARALLGEAESRQLS